MKIHVVVAAIGTLLLSGCDSSPTTPMMSKSQVQTETTKSVSEAVPGVKFEVAPATLRACDPPKVAKVSWNAMAAGVSKVKVFVVDESGVETLFTFSGAEGSADTGPWVRAKTVFLLKDGDQTKQLGKFIVGSENCT